MHSGRINDAGMDREFLFFFMCIDRFLPFSPEYGYLYYKESVGLLTYFKR